MSNPSRLLALGALLLICAGATSVASAAYADPSGRVAHLNHSDTDKQEA